VQFVFFVRGDSEYDTPVAIGEMLHNSKKTLTNETPYNTTKTELFVFSIGIDSI
jgi:hypothetical protein